MNGQKNQDNRPKIGLALSGGSGRAITHIGILEVMLENNIPIDYITACSSATVVVASYAAGTLRELKHALLSIDRGSLLRMMTLDVSRGGVFNLEKFEEFVRRFTLGKTFEEVRQPMSFIACDIETGEPVGMSLGDLARACCISCTLPGLFPPSQWGNRVLVDGGLFNMVPVREVRELGADLVIGVDIAATRYMFKMRYVRAWRGWRFLSDNWIFDFIRWFARAVSRLYRNTIKIELYSQADFLEEQLVEKNPNLFSVLGRALDIASLRHKTSLEHVATCDIMISPQVKHVGKLEMEKAGEMYEEGRRVALQAIPEIRKMIKNYEWRTRSRNMRYKHA